MKPNKLSSERMRTRTIILAALCLLLHTVCTLTAFRAMDLITSWLFLLWIVSLLALVLNLSFHRGDWAFRGPAFMLIAGYVIFMANVAWWFLTQVD